MPSWSSGVAGDGMAGGILEPVGGMGDEAGDRSRISPVWVETTIVSPSASRCAQGSVPVAVAAGMEPDGSGMVPEGWAFHVPESMLRVASSLKAPPLLTLRGPSCRSVSLASPWRLAALRNASSPA